MLISAFAFGGIPRKAITYLLKKSEIYVSPQLLLEYREVPLQLETEGKISREQLKILLVGIASFAENAKVIQPQKNLSICRDLEDNMIFDCCLEAKADLLVTGDRDLLEVDAEHLKAVGLSKLRILTPRGYLRLKSRLIRASPD